VKRPVHLSVPQKHFIWLALNFGAATPAELAGWSGVHVRTVWEIASSGFVNNSKRFRYHAAYKECWR
jgi:hypothetical protein